MKKMLFTLVSMLTIAVSANAMSYERARTEALFLTDKMAYELNLTDEQYEAAYEINLDYLMGVTSRYDVYGTCWERRNMDLEYIFYRWQWDLYRAATYFFRPLYWEAGHWHFGVYIHYPHRDFFYFGRPHFYASYRGGHSWHMNGGHSYYRDHHSHYRPHHSREEHVGMRNNWDRGDYRGKTHHSSSTRHTATPSGTRRTEPTNTTPREIHVGSHGTVTTTSRHHEIDNSRKTETRPEIHSSSSNRSFENARSSNRSLESTRSSRRDAGASMSTSRSHSMSDSRSHSMSSSRSHSMGSTHSASSSHSSTRSSSSSSRGSRR